MALTTPCSLSSPPPPLGHHSTGASLLPLRFFRSPPALQPLRSLLPFSPHVIAKPPYCSISASRSDEKKREILEGYGLDSSDFISYPSSSSSHTPRRKRKGRREVDMGGKGKRVQPHLVEELQPPRTTHRLLQVLGGKAHRKKLLSPKGMDVRPMMEVVRGAAFGILQVAGGCPAALRPGRWLDLYSGTGSVGIEAISRGCAEAHFVEMDPWVVSEVLLPNLEWTGFVDNSVIHTVCVERFLEEAEQSNDMDRSFDYVSVTPPYTAVDYSILMAQLGKSPLIGKDSFILVEYPLKTSLSESCGNLVKVIARPYFDTLVGFSHKNFISSLMVPKERFVSRGLLPQSSKMIADRRFGRTNLAVYGPTWAEKKRK